MKPATIKETNEAGTPLLVVERPMTQRSKTAPDFPLSVPLACILLLSACASGSEMAMSADAPDGLQASGDAEQGAVSLTGAAAAFAAKSARAPIYVSGNVLLPAHDNLDRAVGADVSLGRTAALGADLGKPTAVRVTAPALDAEVSKAGVTAVARLDPLAGVGRGSRPPLTAAAAIGRGGISPGGADATGSLIDATADRSGSSKAVRQAVTRARRLLRGG